jgi:drug/metabolite transporter (DMT)-like permease
MWAVNGTVSKGLLDTGISAMRLSQLRVSAAWLILVVVILLTNRTAFRIRSKQEFLLMAMYGLLGVTMTQWLYFVAIHLLPVGVALVLELTAPLMVAIWVKFAWDHHVPRLTWLGLSIALTGLTLITEVWTGFTLNILGVAAALGAAAALAIYYIVGERVLHLPEPRDPLSLTMWGFAFATAFWAIFQPWWGFPWEYLQGTYEFNGGLTLSRYAMAGFMILIGTVIPFWLSLKAMQFINAQQASAMGLTEPVLAATVAWVVLGEFLSGFQILGAIVTLLGITIAEWARK